MIAGGAGTGTRIFLLCLRRVGEPQPNVQPIRTTRGIIGAQVQRGDITETLLLAHEPVEYKHGNIEFRGCVGMVRMENGKTTLSLPKGRMIRCRDVCTMLCALLVCGLTACNGIAAEQEGIPVRFTLDRESYVDFPEFLTESPAAAVCNSEKGGKARPAEIRRAGEQETAAELGT